MQEPDPELWPCTAQAVGVFVRLRTQWRVGPSGARIALDYTALAPALRLMDVPRAQWKALFEDLQVLEGAALAAL